MPPKHKLIKDAKQSLREHGAETQLQVTNQRQIQSILRPRSAEPEIQAYRSSSHINQAHQSLIPIQTRKQAVAAVVPMTPTIVTVMQMMSVMLDHPNNHVQSCPQFISHTV